MKKYINSKNSNRSWKKKPEITSGNRIFIFDLDGTLYQFDSKGFLDSKFYSDIRKRAYKFLSERLNVSEERAKETYNCIKAKYNGEVSIGTEKEFGINRYDYFNFVWNLEPSDYITKNPLIREIFSKLEGKIAILTGAPKIWARKTLEYLKVYDIVANTLFTGEPDIRKPNPLAFQQVLDYFRVLPEQAISIGDQESTDIIPARKLRIKTILLGSDCKSADFCINKLEEIVPLIGRELK